jgi:hypothetical protein
MNIGHTRQCSEIRHHRVEIDVCRHSIQQGATRLTEDVDRGEQHKNGEKERADGVSQVSPWVYPNDDGRDDNSNGLNQVTNHMNERSLHGNNQ